MINAFLAEWVKLIRRTLIVATLLTAVTVAGLGTVFVLRNAGSTGHPDDAISLTRLAQADGATLGLRRTALLLGVVVLCLFAAAVAQEYSLGTLRSQLVAEPRRVRLLVGRLLALATFVVPVVALAAAVSVALAFALVGSKGVSSSAWASAAGVTSTAHVALNVLLSCLGFGLLGAVLGVLLRSPVLAVGAGIAYALPVDNLLAAAWNGGNRWLPGQLLGTLADGGSRSVSYLTSSSRLVVYLLLAVGLAAAVFHRRDVTA